MMPCMDLSVAIIAGGAARRLGGLTKALLEVEGSSILGRLLRLAPACPVLVVTQTPEQFPALACVPDVVAGKGAPGGVVTALLNSQTEWVLIVAGDMPFVKPNHVQALWQVIHGGVDVAVAARNGEVEPLFGLYRRSLGSMWAQRLHQNPSARALIRSARFVQVEIEPAALESLNTPEDLERFAARKPGPKVL